MADDDIFAVGKVVMGVILPSDGHGCANRVASGSAKPIDRELAQLVGIAFTSSCEINDLRGDRSVQFVLADNAKIGTGETRTRIDRYFCDRPTEIVEHAHASMIVGGLTMPPT